MVDASDAFDFSEVKRHHDILRSILSELTPDRDLSTFTLERTHYVDDALHYQVIGKTRRLIRLTLDFMSKRWWIFGQQLKTLGVYEPRLQCQAVDHCSHQSSQYHRFQLIHKDIYELHDGFGDIPRMINVWIPICGVEGKTGLPIAPNFHLISES